jgi:hypothetical protein
MMNQLYSAAERVLVWLGEARDLSDIAMAQLEELAEREETIVNAKPGLIDLIYASLIDRDWWGRLWIVQEVVLAKSDPIIMCGSSSLAWSRFMKGYTATGFEDSTSSKLHGKYVERLGQCYALKNLRHFYQSQIVSNAGCRLITILTYTEDFHAADPRDKVYGTLGLLGTSEREKLKPDYQKPVELVFLETTQYLLTNDVDRYVGFFSRFSFAINRRTLSRASPSWVPDFSAQNTFSPCNPALMTVPPDHVHKYFCKGRSVSFQDRNRVLALPGVLFDAIDVVVELNDNQKLFLAQIPRLEHLLELAVETTIAADDPLYYLRKSKKHEDIFQVLSAGRNTLSEPTYQPSFRCQYDVLTGGTGASVLGSLKACEFNARLIWFMQHVVPGRCFFVTKRGFFGVAVTKIRENDSVTFLFGESLPIVLRARGLSYCMIGAAHVSGVMNDMVTGDMYDKGLVEKRTFRIR